MPPFVQSHGALWGPVVAGWATLDEVRHRWSIDDLADAEELLAVQAQSAALEVRRARAATSKG